MDVEPSQSSAMLREDCEAAVGEELRRLEEIPLCEAGTVENIALVLSVLLQSLNIVRQSRTEPLRVYPLYLSLSVSLPLYSSSSLLVYDHSVLRAYRA